MIYEIGLFFLLFRYLISKGKGVEARSALQWLRGPGIDISYELADMETANVLNKKNKFKFKELFSMAYFKPLAISMGLMFAQQFSGINAVMFYSVTIFRVMHMYFFFILHLRSSLDPTINFDFTNYHLIRVVDG